MEIAIIGTGNVGKALGGSLPAPATTSRSRPPTRSTPRSAAKTGAHRAAVEQPKRSAAADLVILAVPATALAQIAREIGPPQRARSSSTSSNRPTPDPAGAAHLARRGAPGAAAGRSVVKAFNTASPPARQTRSISGIAADGYVAGDDASAKQTVLDVVESIGFRPVDAGSLAAARTLEGMAWLNISRAIASGRGRMRGSSSARSCRPTSQPELTEPETEPWASPSPA